MKLPPRYLVQNQHKPFASRQIAQVPIFWRPLIFVHILPDLVTIWMTVEQLDKKGHCGGCTARAPGRNERNLKEPEEQT